MFNANIKSSFSYVYFYELQENQQIIKQIKKYIKIHQSKCQYEKLIHSTSITHKAESIEKWLLNIYNAELIVTNSFHGVVFSIIFHKQFVVVPIEGRLTEMNDRIETLLDDLNLKERIMYYFDTNKLNTLLFSEINWKEVDTKKDQLEQIAEKFIADNIDIYK